MSPDIRFELNTHERSKKVVKPFPKISEMADMEKEG
jgi:hypothetical protein